MSSWAKHAAVTAVLLLRSSCDTEMTITQEIEYVWPTIILHTPMVEDADGVAAKKQFLESCEEAAVMAEQGFHNYLNKVLPVELEKDIPFAAAFKDDDIGRLNRGFLRWQRTVFSKASKIPKEEIAWDGSPDRNTKGIDYTWHNWTKSAANAVILNRLLPLLKRYQTEAEATIHGRGLRIFPWAEVYRKGEFQHPHTHTGSSMVGIMALRSNGGSQRISFQDPRGINPPYGKKEAFVMETGDVLIFPSWASHMMDPNLGATTVYLSFTVEGPGGPRDLDWEDDGTGSIVKKETKGMKVKRRDKSKEDKTEL